MWVNILCVQHDVKQAPITVFLLLFYGLSQVTSIMLPMSCKTTHLVMKDLFRNATIGVEGNQCNCNTGRCM